MAVGTTLWNCRVPMRDDVELAADVVLPPGDGPFPAVVTRTPYMRGGNLRPDGWLRLVDHGYAYVVVDMRGRGDSDGQWQPFVNDADDGHDTVEWVAAQDWCTGRVGMVGVSYEGLSQWWAAKGRPPHLRCIAPMAVGAAKVGPRPGVDTGAPRQYWIWWFNLVTGRTWQHPGAASWEANYDHVPLRELHERVGTSSHWWPRYIDGAIDYLSDDFALSATDWAALELPVLVAVGWWDDQTTMQNWLALQQTPGRDKARLLIGAWDHEGNEKPRPVLGGLDVSESVIDTIGHVERFLAAHLKDDADPDATAGGGAGGGRCWVFRTGRMRWENLDDWPDPAATPQAWYLGGDGCTGTLEGTRWPADCVPADGSATYRYDPAHPARDFTALADFAWSDPPLDRRYLLRRTDVLVYAGQALDSPVDVSGRAEFHGFVSVDCPDTDLSVALYDVWPDGRTLILGRPGMLRLNYRDGPRSEPMRLGEVVGVRVPLTWLQHTFLPGHRVALSITSSDFPNYARNFNTGQPWPDATDPRVAQVTVHHGTAHPSRLLLPVEPAAQAS